MSFDFYIAGITTVRIAADTWDENEREFRGVFRRLASGAGVSSQRSPKRSFTATIFFTDPAELALLEVAISEIGAVGVATPVSVITPADGGTRGAFLTCYCWITKYHAVPNGATAYWKCQLSMREA